MTKMEQIITISNHIAEYFHPDQIVLFGSHAYGTPHSASDVDLLVVMPFSGHPAYKALEILEHVNPPFAIDLLVRTPEELQRRIALNDYFLQEIMTKGKIIYAAPHCKAIRHVVRISLSLPTHP